MQADILVFDHDPAGRQGRGNIERLPAFVSRGKKPGTEIILVAIFSEIDAEFRADIDTGIAFNTGGIFEDRLDITVQTPVGFFVTGLFAETELDLNQSVFK